MLNLMSVSMFQEEAASRAAAGIGIGFMVFWLAILVVTIAAMWKVFEKAGQPGWAAIIPIYNIVVMLNIIRKPVWWVILCLIPFVNFIVFIIIVIALAKCFGKGIGFALGMLFLAPIFYAILAWGDATYQAPAAA